MRAILILHKRRILTLKFKSVSVTYFIYALSRVIILKLNYVYCVRNILSYPAKILKTKGSNLSDYDLPKGAGLSDDKKVLYFYIKYKRGLNYQNRGFIKLYEINNRV